MHFKVIVLTHVFKSRVCMSLRSRFRGIFINHLCGPSYWSIQLHATVPMFIQWLDQATVQLSICCCCCTDCFLRGGDRNSQSSNHCILFIRVSTDRGRERRMKEAERGGRRWKEIGSIGALWQWRTSLVTAKSSGLIICHLSRAKKLLKTHSSISIRSSQTVGYILT